MIAINSHSENPKTSTQEPLIHEPNKNSKNEV